MLVLTISSKCIWSISWELFGSILMPILSKQAILDGENQNIYQYWDINCADFRTFFVFFWLWASSGFGLFVHKSFCDICALIISVFWYWIFWICAHGNLVVVASKSYNLFLESNNFLKLCPIFVLVDGICSLNLLWKAMF